MLDNNKTTYSSFASKCTSYYGKGLSAPRSTQPKLKEEKGAGKEGISANASRGTNDWVLTSHQLSSKLRKACAKIILNEKPNNC
jgi:hypothetical protein